MPAPTHPNPKIYGYHAHVYYDAATKPIVERFHERLSTAYPVEMGQFSGERVGPHPVPQFQIIFESAQFQEVVTWMMLHRDGLDILVHPLTDDMIDDHTDYALWLGQPVALVLDQMQRRGYRDPLLPASERAAA
ncbi:MAG TPA: DOPA 4,5-dioxygenase family protein [Stellaceae bacterium]|nr:DOPA 4,5-dioxygenase family protein [Stellaceae bacterium]